MIFAIDFEKQGTESAIEKTLQLVCTAFGLTFGPLAEAQVIISDTPDSCLQHLKQGKDVVQFIYWKQPPAEGLLETYPDRFQIFRLLYDESDKNGVAALLAHLTSLMDRKE